MIVDSSESLKIVDEHNQAPTEKQSDYFRTNKFLLWLALRWCSSFVRAANSFKLSEASNPGRFPVIDFITPLKATFVETNAETPSRD